MAPSNRATKRAQVTGDAIRYSSSLAIFRFNQLEQQASLHSAKRLLDWQDEIKRIAELEDDEQQRHPTPFLTEVAISSSLAPSAATSTKRMHRPVSAQTFNLDARGLPRSPLHPPPASRNHPAIAKMADGAQETPAPFGAQVIERWTPFDKSAISYGRAKRPSSAPALQSRYESSSSSSSPSKRAARPATATIRSGSHRMPQQPRFRAANDLEGRGLSPFAGVAVAGPPAPGEIVVRPVGAMASDPWRNAPSSKFLRLMPHQRDEAPPRPLTELAKPPPVNPLEPSLPDAPPPPGPPESVAKPYFFPEAFITKEQAEEAEEKAEAERKRAEAEAVARVLQLEDEARLAAAAAAEAAEAAHRAADDAADLVDTAEATMNMSDQALAMLELERPVARQAPPTALSVELQRPDAALAPAASRPGQPSAAEVPVASDDFVDAEAAPAPPPGVELATEEEAQAAAKALGKLALFALWRPYGLLALCRQLHRRDIRRYECLYREGAPSNAFYVVMAGAVAMTLEDHGGPSHSVSTAGNATAQNVANAQRLIQEEKQRRERAGEVLTATNDDGGDGGGAGRAAAVELPARLGGKPVTTPEMMGKPVYDPALGRYVGYDCSIYADALLGPGSVLGVEALGQSEPGDPACVLPRQHTATTFTQTTVLVLPTHLVRTLVMPHAKLAHELSALGTQRRAELTVIQQGLPRVPIFSSLQPGKLISLAKFFTVRVCAPGVRLASEGERYSAFCVLAHGRCIVTQRTAWGRMRAALGTSNSMSLRRDSSGGGKSGMQSEVVVQTLRHDDKMPFIGEAALEATAANLASRSGRADELAKTTVRASERTTILHMPREHASQFALEQDRMPELLLQRKQVLMQHSMHHAAVEAAIEKHKEDVAHPSLELKEALALARKANLHYNGPRFRNPPPPPDPHPHVPAPTQVGGSRGAFAARQAMAQGMQVHQFATSMGLTAAAGAAGAAGAGSGAGREAGGAGGQSAAAAAGGGGNAPSNRRGGLVRSKTASGRLTMAEKAQGLGGPASHASGNVNQGDSAGGRFLDALWELECAKKVLAEF
jgi:CRP-like cAMP-binding protein